MTKIYLVCRIYHHNGIKETSVNGVFTNLKKAKSLKRYYDALDVRDKEKYPTVYETVNPKTIVDVKTIDNFDYTIAAEEQEIKNLPF